MIAVALAVSPLRYDDLSRTTVTVIAAAGSIGRGAALAVEATDTATARKAITNTRPRAWALQRRAKDKRRPLPESAGKDRGRRRRLSDLLNHFVGYLSDLPQERTASD